MSDRKLMYWIAAFLVVCFTFNNDSVVSHSVHALPDNQWVFESGHHRGLLVNNC